MPAALVVVLLTVHALTATIAFLVNLILLVIIVLNTPKPIRTYSVLIVNYVLTDLFTSMAQAITVPRSVRVRFRRRLLFSFPGDQASNYRRCDDSANCQKIRR